MERHPVKLQIVAHSDQEMTSEVGQFTLPVNPEQYAQKFQVKYDAKVPPGGSGVEERFLSSGPEELRLDFIFDSTGTIYGYVEAHQGKSVPQQIQEFKEVVYDLAGDIHQPRFLKVKGMDINFPCILTDLQITYTLFKADGTPIRAKLSATFLNFKEVRRRVNEENKSSPDLTHVRPVNDGDKLPLMAFRIYKDTKYYLEVARVNGLTNFRQLRTGQDVIFPPIEKTTGA